MLASESLPLTCAPEKLMRAFSAVIPHVPLVRQTLPQTAIDLWLITPDLPTQKLDDAVVSRIWQDTPYWVFCWASGLAMAQFLLKNSALVKDKTVLDFGAGSGVVAIAAKLAGAKKVIACDIDPVSLQACAENAAINQVDLHCLADLYSLNEPVDVLLAADVLYDQANRFFLDDFLKFASEVWVADSRVRNFEHPCYEKYGVLTASTWPDLDEAQEFRNVSFYKTKNKA